MKLLSATFLFILSLNASAGFDFLTHSGFVEFIDKQIEKQSVSADLGILDFQNPGGFSQSSKASAKSEPSYVNGYYTRMDEITLNTGINISKFLDTNQIPFGFNMSHNANILFARQFKSQWDSIKARPYNIIENFPINADKAKNNLKTGDFVSFHSALNFVVSKGFYAYYNAGLSASASAYTLISGDFLINIYKISENKIRVKFIATTGDGSGLGVNGGYHCPLRAVGFELANRRIVDWVNFDLNAGGSMGHSNVFLIDFIFNLDDPKAATAYTNLISSKAVFRDVSILNPLQSDDTLAEKLLTDMSEVENLVKEDRSLPVSERRVDLVFEGANAADADSTSINFGFKLLHFSLGQNFIRNRISNVDRFDSKKKFLFDVFSKSHRYDALYDLVGGEEIINSNLLLTAKDDWSPDQFYALSLSKEVRAVNFSKKDLQNLQTHVAAVLPKIQYEKIDWKNWQFPTGSLLNASFKHTIFFYREAINQMQTHDPKVLKDLLTKYLVERPRVSCTPHLRKNYGLSEDSDIFYTRNSWLSLFDDDIEAIAKSLAITFNPNESTLNRYNAFLKVKDFPLFIERGAGFLLSLLPQDNIQNLIGYELTLSAKDVEAVSFKLGEIDHENLYKSLLYIQSIINNRSFDLRLYADENGEFKPN
jgi:hypothetical protein